MGTANYLKCTDCGKEWLHSAESGFASVLYYCNCCGKKRVVKEDRASEVSRGGECFCGGRFERSGEDIACPKCHGRNIVQTSEIAVLWG